MNNNEIINSFTTMNNSIIDLICKVSINKLSPTSFENSSQTTRSNIDYSYKAKDLFLNMNNNIDSIKEIIRNNNHISNSSFNLNFLKIHQEDIEILSDVLSLKR